MIDPEIVHNVIIINNTNLSYDEIINQYELTTDYRSKFSPRVQKPPQVFNMFAKYGSEPEMLGVTFYMFVVNSHGQV